jgi:hypothetical protein
MVERQRGFFSLKSESVELDIRELKILCGCIGTLTGKLKTDSSLSTEADNNVDDSMGGCSNHSTKKSEH